MNEQQRMLVTIRDNPQEDTPRLVYADWLEDHGEHDRGEVIRLMVNYHGCSLEDKPFNGPHGIIHKEVGLHKDCRKGVDKPCGVCALCYQAHAALSLVAELIALHWREWTHGICCSRFRWERGFIVITFPCSTCDGHGTKPVIYRHLVDGVRHEVGSRRDCWVCKGAGSERLLWTGDRELDKETSTRAVYVQSREPFQISALYSTLINQFRPTTSEAPFIRPTV